MTKRKHKATIGSISHGTMRDEDLIPCFLNHIQYLDPKRITKLRKDPEWLIITNQLKKGNTDFDDIGKRILRYNSEPHTVSLLSDAGFYWSDYTSDLFDILNEFAPPYCSFGSSEGDGSDYGFWPDVESAKEGVGFVSGMEPHDPDDNDYPPKGYSGEWVHVSDHGNVTLYYRNSKGKDTEIWGVV